MAQVPAAAGTGLLEAPQRLFDQLGRLGERAWRTLTSVRFAVVQLILLALTGLIGTLVRQVPSSALRNPTRYAAEISDMHQRWDGIAPFGVRIGPGIVELFDRLGFFRVFSAPWFVVLLTVLVLSIVCCTLARLPRLWRESRRVRVVQPAAFFNLRLPHRAMIERAGSSPADVARLLRSRHYRVRNGIDAGGAVTVMSGDRNQYVKLATLLTHLGLILFLLGGLITVTFGFETVVFVGEGQTAPVQAVGTRGNLLVKNIRFDAPRLPNGMFADFSTDLAVYQDGVLLARKTIRVNDPLEVAGFVFHQNTFGPSVDLRITGPDGRLAWTGPVILDGLYQGVPQGMMAVPGSNLGLLIMLDQRADGVSRLALEGVGPLAPDGSTDVRFVVPVGLGESTDPRQTSGYTVSWEGVGAWTGMVVKKDPGQGIIWLAFASLISGLVLSFYFPRRRVWARFESDTIRIAMVADRYVDVERELGALVERLRASNRRSVARVVGSS